MQTSKAEIFVHFVWATKEREPMIPPKLEPELYRVIPAQVKRAGCATIALNGTSDHVHLLVKYGRNVTVGKLMNQVKGVSSAFMNDRLRGEISAFRWQATYGAIGVCSDHLECLQKYIANQKRHHAEGTTLPEWEETCVETGEDGDAGEPDA